MCNDMPNLLFRLFYRMICIVASCNAFRLSLLRIISPYIKQLDYELEISIA